MSKKSINFIIPLEVYPFDVYVSIGESNKKLSSDLDKLCISDDDIDLAMFKHHTVKGRCVMFSSNQTIIRLRKFPNDAVTFSRLQHEIFHAVSFILDRIGMKLVIMKSCEAYAYLTEYLTRKIYEKIL